MTVTETLGALGSWELRLVDETPQDVLDQLGFYGHLAIAPGSVDVDSVGDSILDGARYVGILRGKGKGDPRRIAGHSMLVWLGDQDGKGHVLEAPVTLTNATLLQAVTAVLPPSVRMGTVHPQPAPAARYTGKHVLQDPRKALTTICDAFGVEFRVNGNGKVDVGTQEQLYQGVPRADGLPAPIIARKPGSDIDLRAIEGDLDTEEAVYDYSTDIVLVGQTVGTGDAPDEVFAIGRRSAPAVPYVDLFGQPVKFTRLISESGETTGSVDQRSQLHLNRFSRVARSLSMRAEEYDSEGSFAVGDMAYVYDPQTGIVDPSRELHFRGERIWPDVIRVSGMTWPVTRGHTVAFRTGAGKWLDLTAFVTWETGGGEIAVGDLPRSLSRPGDDPLALRVDAARGRAEENNTAEPGAPTDLALSTYSSTDGRGVDRSYLRGSWVAPATNADGTVPVNVAYYSVRYRAVGQSVWENLFTAETTLDIEVVLDTDYEVQVAAVNQAGRIGAYTATVAGRSAADTVAPPAPADAIVTARPLLLRIESTGTTSTGGVMPKDTRQIDMHVGLTAGFTPTPATRVNSVTPFARGVHYIDLPYGQTRYVKLVAVDHSGNQSTPSGAVAGASTQAGDGDIGSLSVSKLTAGVMNADVTISGRFTTALTGQRMELNSLAVQGFNASEQQTINLDGVNNLLTGILKTALTGRRIEIAAAGDKGEVNFYNPNNVRSLIRGFTTRLSEAGLEAIQLGVPIANTANSWNSISVATDEEMWLNSGFVHVLANGQVGQTYHGFTVSLASDKGNVTTGVYNSVERLRVDRVGFRVRNAVGDVLYYTELGFHQFRTPDASDVAGRVEIVSQNYGTANVNNSAKLRFVSAHGDAAGILKFYAAVNNQTPRFEFRNGWTDGGSTADESFWPISASAFNVNSDRASKRDIRDLPSGALDRLRPARVRDYTLANDTAPEPRRHVGLVAQEAPVEVVVDYGESGLAVDLYALTSLNTAAIQELAKQVDEIKKGKP